MNTLKPIRRVTLSEQIAIQIAQMITTGAWTEGQKLPTESELGRMLGVGRSTLREALKSLAFVGMVQIKAGEGTWVARRRSAAVEEILGPRSLEDENDLRDMAEARVIIEMETASLCARCASSQDLEVLRDLLGRMDAELGRPEQYMELDVAFHLAIAEASHNRQLAKMLRDIRRQMEEYISQSLRNVPQSAEVAHQQHSGILSAIEAQNALKARTLMREHLFTFLRGYAVLVRIAEVEPDVRQVVTGLAVNE